MTLVNGMPIDDATGKVLGTSSTPEATWPALAGRAYDPTTGALAVSDTVPASTDPWNGGIRFTNLGAMFITTALPSPAFNVAGLTVSADGRVFVSSSVGAIAVSGWPIAADGGLSMAGLAPPGSFAPTVTSGEATTVCVESITFNGLVTSNGAATTVIFEYGLTTAFGSSVAAIQSPLPAGAVGAVVSAVVTGLIGGTQYFYRAKGTNAAGSTNGANKSQITAIFYAQLTSSLTAVGLGVTTPSFVRASVAFAKAVPPAGNAVDGTLLIEVPANEARFIGARRVSAGVWSALYADGSAIPAANLLGYQAENLVQNRIWKSQELNDTVWAKDASTITANSIAAPDGTTTADTYTDNNTSANHRVYFPSGSVVAFVSGTIYTVSVYAKAGTLTWLQVAYTPDGTAVAWANFNLVTGALGAKDSGTTSSIESMGNGWYRCIITKVAAASGNGFVVFSSINANTASVNPVYTGTTQTYYLWGVQLEIGSKATSYVISTLSPATRPMDDLQYFRANNLLTTVGTIYAEPTYGPHDALYPKRATLGLFVDLDDIPQYVDSAGKLTYMYGGVAGAVSGTAVNVDTPNKIATAYGSATASVCVNGGAVGSGAWATWPSGPTAIEAAFNTTDTVNGSIRNLKVFGVKFTDAEIIAMTT